MHPVSMDPFRTMSGMMYSWFKVNQDRSGYVSGVVALKELSASSKTDLHNAYLVKEYILAIASFGREVLEVSVSTDAVLLT